LPSTRTWKHPPNRKQCQRRKISAPISEFRDTTKASSLLARSGYLVAIGGGGGHGRRAEGREIPRAAPRAAAQGLPGAASGGGGGEARHGGARRRVLEAEKNAEMGRNHSRGWTEPKSKIYFGLFIGSPARVLSWGRGAMGPNPIRRPLRRGRLAPRTTRLIGPAQLAS
jgi:hypothetical protein